MAEEEIRPGLLVVIVETPLIRELAPHLIGELFTIHSGPHNWSDDPQDGHLNRPVWMMEEMVGCCDMHHYCFSRDEFKPLPPPDELIFKCQQEDLETTIELEAGPFFETEIQSKEFFKA